MVQNLGVAQAGVHFPSPTFYLALVKRTEEQMGGAVTLTLEKTPGFKGL